MFPISGCQVEEIKRERERKEKEMKIGKRKQISCIHLYVYMTPINGPYHMIICTSFSLVAFFGRHSVSRLGKSSKEEPVA